MHWAHWAINQAAGTDIVYAAAQPAGPIVEAARSEGLIVITAGKGDVVRLVPPLIITDEDVDLCIAILSRVIQETMP